MICPECGHDASLWQQIKTELYCRLPEVIQDWLDKRQEIRDFKELKHLFLTVSTKTLSQREIDVSAWRINGKSLEVIAQAMNITRTRVRYIQMRALLKLRRVK